MLPAALVRFEIHKKSMEELLKKDQPLVLVQDSPDDKSDIDIYLIHEQRAGRLVLDPIEARREFGDEIASKLKVTPDGKFVLWPQPMDDPEDPQNWSDRQKNLQLFIIILASTICDFDSAIGIAAVFSLAKQFNTTTTEINDLTSNWSIFLTGWGGVFFVMWMRKYGRLGALFWTQLLALGFMVGATFAPNLKTFAAMRCITSFFGTCPQITGLYTITDLFPFHQQARKINYWTMAIIISPHASPFLFGFVVARTTWRWAYGAATLYSVLILTLIVLFSKETMYHRGREQKSQSQSHYQHKHGLRYRALSLLGVVGFRDRQKDPSWKEVMLAPVKLIWRPQLALMLFLEAVVFGFSIGVNLTNTLLLQAKLPFGFGLGPITVSVIYITPVISALIGEIFGRYLNDWIMNLEIRRHGGVFEAEARLWTCYIGVFLYIIGIIILGIGLQDHLSLAAVIIGWGIFEMATLVVTTAVYSYCNDAFPHERGEISALLNLFRVLLGFSVTFFQVKWAQEHGALQSLGCEAATVAGSFLLIVPFLQWKGRYLRERFSPKHPER